MTGMSAPQAWADLAFNPMNVPRVVPNRLQRFMPLESITLDQRNLLQDLITWNGIGDESLRVLFGDGYESLDRLSKWAASWAITVIRDFEERVTDAEPALKAHIADHYIARNPELRRVSVDE